MSGGKSKPTAPAVIVPDPPQAVAPIQYLVGLSHVGPNSYAVVRAKLRGNEMISYEIEQVAQPLQFAAESLRASLRKLIGEIP